MRKYIRGFVIASSIHLVLMLIIFILLQTAFYEMLRYNAAFFWKPIGYGAMYLFFVTDFPFSYIFSGLQIRNWLLLPAQLLTSFVWGAVSYLLYSHVISKRAK